MTQTELDLLAYAEKQIGSRPGELLISLSGNIPIGFTEFLDSEMVKAWDELPRLARLIVAVFVDWLEDEQNRRDDW